MDGGYGAINRVDKKPGAGTETQGQKDVKGANPIDLAEEITGSPAGYVVYS